MYAIVYLSYYSGVAATQATGKGAMPELPQIFNIGWLIFFLILSLAIEFAMVYFEKAVGEGI